MHIRQGDNLFEKYEFSFPPNLKNLSIDTDKFDFNKVSSLETLELVDINISNKNLKQL